MAVEPSIRTRSLAAHALALMNFETGGIAVARLPPRRSDERVRHGRASKIEASTSGRVPQLLGLLVAPGHGGHVVTRAGERPDPSRSAPVPPMTKPFMSLPSVPIDWVIVC